MKKIIILMSALFVVGISHAQTLNLSTNQNYVYTKNYLSDPNTGSPKTVETAQYFDGLGRAKQLVNIKASPLGRDVVTHIEYDASGKQVKDYLPVPQSGTANGAIITNPLANAVQADLYGSEIIFGKKEFENSPLNRILEQEQVGTAWADKPVKFDYDANTGGEVKKYAATFNYSTFVSGIVLLSTSYATGELYKNTVTDEDGNKTIEFKNWQGQVVLVRKMLDETNSADTYYVYNNYNQLAYVIPPLEVAANAVDDTTLNNLCYQYKYDGRNRLVEKKLPGKGWEYMVYDKTDRLIMTQDANLGQQGKWLITKYDQFGRVAYTGIIRGGSRDEMQSQAGPRIIAELRNSTGFTRNGMQIYYGNNLFVDIETVLSVNYYDTYPTGTPTIPTQVMGRTVSTDVQNADISTKGLPVASYVKNIEDDNWTKNYTWYDTKGRVIGSHSINHLGGYTKTESELDFSGTPKMVVTRHKRLDSDAERVITENFTYDHQNRLLTHTHQVDNNPVEYLVQNKYNELSQLESKKVGGAVSGNGLQQVDYKYNIRGWMTKINDPSNLNGDLFGYELKYQNPVNTSQSPAKFNGNIAEIDWKTTNDGVMRRYGYQYDGLNRLLKGIYQEPQSSVPQNNFYNEEQSYDLSGNILTLRRNQAAYDGSTALLLDNLNYNYHGNKLTSVTDTSGNYGGYPDVGGNTIDYDVNGNIKNQKDKGILQIDYNLLNLPKEVKFDATYIIRNKVTGESEERNVRSNYLYRADGTKLKKKYIYFFNKGNSERIVTTDYLDGFQYTTSYAGLISLNFVPTSEGYFDFEKNKYIYNYSDHLGNVRLSYMHNGNSIEVLEENNYYPFGLKHEGYNGLAGNANYNYKYNSKELQTETGMYDYGARFYMPDIGRWGVIDPLAERYIKASPYHYAFNNPIFFKDPNGKEIIIYYQTDDGRQKQWSYSYSKNRKTTGNEFLDNAIAGLDKLYTSNALNLDTNGDGEKDKNYLQKIIDDKRVLSVVEGETTRFYMGLSYNEKYKHWNTKDPIDIGKITFNSKKGILFNNSEDNDENRKALISRYQGGKFSKDDKINSPTAGLGHEIIHAGNFLLDNANYFQRQEPFKNVDKNGFTNNEEIRTTILSNQVNEALNEPQRQVYWGIKIPTESVTSNKVK